MFKLIGRLVYKLFKVEIRDRRNWRKDNKWLIDLDFQTIIDIGANEGQFASKMRKFFPNANIISFEPIPHVYEVLKYNFQNDDKFTAYPYGLGDTDMNTEFYENENTASSSLLKLKDHTSHFNAAVNTKPIQISVKKLDDILTAANLKKPIMVKIDVQGFEDKVIAGGRNVLSNSKLILCEVSFTQLYEGQKLFNDIDAMMSELGFLYCGNYEQLHSPANNAILQADAIFIKKA